MSSNFPSTGPEYPIKQPNIIEAPAGDELLLYDTEAHRAFRLEPTGAYLLPPSYQALPHAFRDGYDDKMREGTGASDERLMRRAIVRHRTTLDNNSIQWGRNV